MDTFCTCVPSKATLQDVELIHHCRTMYKTRTLELDPFTTLALQFHAALFLNHSSDPMNEPVCS